MTDIPGFGHPTPQPPPAAPRPNGGKRGAARKGQGKGRKRKAKKAKAAAPRKAAAKKQQRRGPAALTMNVESAFKVLQGCKRKDVAAIETIVAALNPLNRPSRERVLDAVRTIMYPNDK